LQLKPDPLYGLEAMSALLPFALILLALATGLRRVSGSTRLLVFRLGSINRLAGPGVTYVIPAFERNVRVDLDDVTSDWRALDEGELLQRIIT
jgi:regulator of protease activity HflC (stomatin/prohibitin superfamily)